MERGIRQELGGERKRDRGKDTEGNRWKNLKRAGEREEDGGRKDDEERAGRRREARGGGGGRVGKKKGEGCKEKEDGDRREDGRRDVVAREINHELIWSGSPCVLLDISHEPAEKIKDHFPAIYQRCARNGIDITSEPIPVVPAAHYSCGGVTVDLNGQTSIQNLYACGEVACSGCHGANRLASNSLLEAVVFGHRAAKAVANSMEEIASNAMKISELSIPPVEYSSNLADGREQDLAEKIQSLRKRVGVDKPLSLKLPYLHGTHRCRIPFCAFYCCEWIRMPGGHAFFTFLRDSERAACGLIFRQLQAHSMRKSSVLKSQH